MTFRLLSNRLCLLLILILFTYSSCKPRKTSFRPKHSSVTFDETGPLSNQTTIAPTINSTSGPTVDVTNYLSLLHSSDYYGQWVLSNNEISNNIYSFNNNNGIFVIGTQTSELPASGGPSNVATPQSYSIKQSELVDSSNEPTSNSGNLFQILFKVYDGQYLDQRSLRINYELNSTGNMTYSAETATIYETSKISGISFQTPGGTQTPYQACTLNISMSFLNINTMTPYQGPFTDDTGNIGITVNITSADCNFSLHTNDLTSQGLYTSSELTVYIISSCIVSVIQSIGVVLVKKTFSKRSFLFNISATSLFLTAAIDYYILVLNLIMIFADTSILCIPFAFNVFLTFVLERDLLLKLIQTRAKRSGSGLSDDDCKACGCYFIVIAVFFVIELAFVLMYQLWALYLTGLVLIPQIVQNAYKDRTYKFNYAHICLMVLPKLAMVAYLKLDKSNVFRVSPEPTFVAIYALILLTQILVLVIQTRYPRLFIRSEYARRDSRALTEDDLCPICMGHLACNNPDISPTLPRKKTIEIICTHSFHTQCLKKWLDTKTECPMCRKNISDLLEEMDLSEEDPRSPELRSPAVVYDEPLYYSHDL